MFLCIPHQSLMMRQLGQWTIVRKDPHLKIAASASPHDSKETTRLDEDSGRSSIVDYCMSPTLALLVLALTWQRDMWLHAAYAV